MTEYDGAEEGRMFMTANTLRTLSVRDFARLGVADVAYLRLRHYRTTRSAARCRLTPPSLSLPPAAPRGRRAPTPAGGPFPQPVPGSIHPTWPSLRR